MASAGFNGLRPLPKAKTPEELAAEQSASPAPLSESDQWPKPISETMAASSPPAQSMVPISPQLRPLPVPQAAPAFNPMADTGINPPEPMPAASPPMALPSSKTTTVQETSTKKGMIVPEDLKQQLSESVEARIQAERQKSDVESLYAGMQAELLDEHAQKQTKQIEAQRRTEETRKLEVDNRMKAYDSSVQEMLNQKVNPDQFWANKGMSGRVGAAIAMGLGAYGNAVAGGGNAALSIITDAINRDIDAQKANISIKKEGVQAKQTAFGMILSKHGDERVAETLARDLLLKDTTAKLTSMAAKSKVPAIQANAQGIIAGLNEERTKNSLKLWELAQDQKTVATKTQEVDLPPVKPGENQELANKFQSFLKDQTSFQDWKKTRSALTSFQSLKEGGAEGAAVADFIANGLKQSSFSPDFLEVLKKRGMLDKAGEFVREKFVGGYDPELVKSMENGLKLRVQMLEKQAKPSINQAKVMGQQLYGNSDIFLETGEQSLLPSDKRNKK